MKILLTAEVDRLGVAGDSVSVKAGYARNFLFPRGLAMPDTEGNRNTLAHVYQRTWKIQHNKQRKEAQRHVETWGLISIEIPMRIGEDGKMFGAVTSSDIAEAVKSQRNIDIDRRKLQLDDPIKSIGEHVVTLKLHADVTTSVHVNVIPIVVEPVEEPEVISDIEEHEFTGNSDYDEM